MAHRNILLFAGVGVLFLLTGLMQSWNLSLQILNIGILSAIMALGVNMQWGYAGLFSTGIMGSVALGGRGNRCPRLGPRVARVWCWVWLLVWR